MNVQNFHEAFERMRFENMGKQFERRELGLLALKYGIYFNSTMWACGLGSFFNVGKLGKKFVYSFRNIPTNINLVNQLSTNMTEYRRNDERKIEHARAILRRYGVQVD